MDTIDRKLDDTVDVAISNAPLTRGLIKPPDYAGRSIVNLMASLAKGLGAPAHPYAPLAIELPDIARFRNVVLLVVDGLGAALVQQHTQCRWLNEHLLTTIDSVFPSTTASAITTFLTGVAPHQHGLTGWHVYTPELDCIAAVLPCRPRTSGEKIGRRGGQLLYDQRAFTDQLPVKSYSIVPSWIADSRFNLAYSKGAESQSYAALPDFFKVVSATVKQATRHPAYYYAYYPELDRRAHEYGCQSHRVRELLESLDTAFADLMQELHGTETLLIVTADHGFIDTTAKDRIELEQHPHLAQCLKRPLCGESRVAYCYVKDEKRGNFVDYVQNELSEQMLLVEPDTLLGQGYYGFGNPHPHLRDRIGDYILILRDSYTLKDWLPHEEPYLHIGVHGGMTLAEREVPLVLASST